MIETIKTWLISVVMVTMLLGLLRLLIPAGSVQKVASFIGGLILMTALLQPLLRIDLSDLKLDGGEYRADIRLRQEELEEAEAAAWAEEVSAQTEDHIWEQAHLMNLEVSVQVETEPGPEGVPVPAAAEITGPYADELAVYMEKQLGIPAQRQTWNMPET